MEAIKSGGGDYSQLRRLHIIYILSQTGRIEQPHLFRVHHLARNGVYLRDVKRWLGDLRGKDMPDAFSWSYKRKYKTGYVWQDLQDDDLITPISDNEYVLKGSEVLNSPVDHNCLNKDFRRSSSVGNQEKMLHDSPKSKALLQNQPPKSSSDQIHEECFSSERSSITDEYDSMKLDDHHDDEKNLEASKQDHKHSSFYSNLLLSKKNTTKSKTDISAISNNTPPTSSSSISSSSSDQTSPSPLGKSKSHSVVSASSMFRNLITCGAVDTNDKAVKLLINHHMDKNESKNPIKAPDFTGPICRGDMLGGSARLPLQQSWDNQLQNHQQHRNHSTFRKSVDGGKSPMKKQQQTEFSSSNTISAAYKPVKGPNCSQCGKTFKPEKMHAHMRSCRGVKALGKSRTTASDYGHKTSTSDRCIPSFHTKEPASSASSSSSSSTYLLNI